MALVSERTAALAVLIIVLIQLIYAFLGWFNVGGVLSTVFNIISFIGMIILLIWSVVTVFGKK